MNTKSCCSLLTWSGAWKMRCTWFVCHPPERDLDTYLDAIEQGEGFDDAWGLRGAAAHVPAAALPAGGSRPPAGRSPDALGVLAAFSRD